jgi:fumarylacetoacetase
VQNAGRIVLNNEKPPPGFFYFPSAYAGRAASVVVSGTPIVRPWGHRYCASTKSEKNLHDQAVVFAPTQAFDYEMEFAAIIGKPLAMGNRLTVSQVDEHVFGFVLLNDWSGEQFAQKPSNV